MDAEPSAGHKEGKRNPLPSKHKARSGSFFQCGVIIYQLPLSFCKLLGVLCQKVFLHILLGLPNHTLVFKKKKTELFK